MLDASKISNLENFQKELPELHASLETKTLTLLEYTKKRNALIEIFNELRTDIIDFSKESGKLSTEDAIKLRQLIEQMTNLGKRFGDLLPKPETLVTKKPYSITEGTNRSWFSDIEITSSELGSMKIGRYFGTSGNGADFYMVQIGEKHYILQVITSIIDYIGLGNMPRLLEINKNDSDAVILANIQFKDFSNIELTDAGTFTDPPVTNAYMRGIQSQLDAVKTFAVL